MPIVVIATITPLPRFQELVRRAIIESVPAIHAEEGCELYAVHDTGDAIVIVEQWSDTTALEAHGVGDPVQKVQATITDKLVRPPSLVHAAPAPAGDPRRGNLVAKTS